LIINVCLISQAILGGNISVIGTGAAPIEAKVLTFLRVVLGCWVCVTLVFGVCCVFYVTT
jgi:long-subunit acyl-CoA synthetase (AMP-forming)